MIYSLFPSSSLKRVKLPIKPGQEDKEPDLPNKYIKKPILEEVPTGFRIPKQRVYKKNKKSGQFQLPENIAAV